MSRSAHCIVVVTALVMLVVLLFANVRAQEELDTSFETDNVNSSEQDSKVFILPLHITSGIPFRVKCSERYFFANGKCHPILFHGEKNLCFITHVHCTRRDCTMMIHTM
jgi:hypothetical protein